METARKRKTRAEAHLEESLKEIWNAACETNCRCTSEGQNPLCIDTDVVTTAQVLKAGRYGLLPEIDRLIYSGNKTIIIWKDGDKTIVSCGEMEEYDHYTGFCAAVVKKIFGSTSAAKKIMNRMMKDCNEKKGNEQNEKV